MIRKAVAVVAVGLVLGGCGNSNDDAESTPDIAAAQTDDDRFPDVLAVEPSFDGDTWQFAVTMSSPYDTPERYADGWRVIGLDGARYGEHTLAHDHAGEQPFTRTQTGVRIPDSVVSVIIEGRDQTNGYGGDTVTVDLTTIREETGNG